MLYKIKLDDKDKKLLAKSLKKNKDFLSSVQMAKKKFDAADISMIERALNYRYKYSTSKKRLIAGIKSSGEAFLRP
ncbi:hypothetical protein Lpp219_14606 [Lacticaseibacillus paracasei subsp. paracasei Lpp219]|nr:hypothetical protein Lpp219_14606 [Lacticaseibacillus paracasei subsp. paracasei Lpp219]